MTAGSRGGYVSPCLKLLLALHEHVWPLIWKQISSSQEGESFLTFVRGDNFRNSHSDFSGILDDLKRVFKVYNSFP